MAARKTRDEDEESHAEPAEPTVVKTVDVLSRVRGRALAKITGGPVEQPIVRIGDVYRLAWLATDAADPEIHIELPPGDQYTPSLPEIEGTAVSTEGRLVRIGVEASGAKWGQLQAMESIGKALGDLPDGTVVELLTSPAPWFWERSEETEPEQDPNAGVQRYRGAVRHGAWMIEEAFPAVDAAALHDALTLSTAITAGRKLDLRDEAEGADVQRRLESDRSLFMNNPVVLKGTQIGLSKKDVSLLHFVGIAIFRSRFASVWPGYKEDEAANAAFEDAMKKLSEQIAAKVSKAMTPKGDLELVLEGKIGKFQKTDLAKERRLEDHLIEASDRQMTELGYRHVGDLVCDRFPDVIVRGYAQVEGDTWGAYLAGALESSFEFVTQFEKNAGLTTTFKEGPADEPRRGLYRSRHPQLNFRKLKRLHAEHEKRKAALGKKLGATKPAPVDLQAFARAVDEGVSRQIA